MPVRTLITEDPRTPDPTTDPVCEFYTHHPYPPPVENLDRAGDEWQDANRHRAEFHLFWPDRPYRADFDILVAGCGTWQAAKYAVTHPRARVVGIDVSMTSLEHTEQLKRQYELTNLETARLPIEEAAALTREFDLVVCTGVLHHLADANAGLRALRSVMRPDAALNLMLYARYGRIGITMLREYSRALGVGTSEPEIAALVATLMPLPQHHPAVALLREARDSRDVDALADALLNPRERSYSVPELFDFIERNGCAFDRWHTQAPYLPQCGAFATTPHAARVASLPPRAQYAAMELWRGTIAAHSVILRRDDAPDRSSDAGPAGNAVPIRLPYTICVQEHLPPGAAGVLLNRSHPHRDLILPLDATEKRVFDAIDGRRTIAEIARDVRIEPRSRARDCFAKLWWYDQVVFDSSRAPSVDEGL